MLTKQIPKATMSRMSGKRIMLGLFNAMGIISASGCYPAVSDPGLAQPVNAAGSANQRLIIKFKSAGITCDADGIAKLSATTRVSIEFIRPMSGDACVIQQSADSPEGLVQGQEVLRRHPAVEWLEQDRKMRALIQK
jgi:hypothetical protein